MNIVFCLQVGDTWPPSTIVRGDIYFILVCKEPFKTRSGNKALFSIPEIYSHLPSPWWPGEEPARKASSFGHLILCPAHKRHGAALPSVPLRAAVRARPDVTGINCFGCPRVQLFLLGKTQQLCLHISAAERPADACNLPGYFGISGSYRPSSAFCVL